MTFAPTLARALAVTTGAATVTVGTHRLLQRVPGARERLSRKNFRGEPVTLAEGPAVVAGLAVAGCIDPPVAFAAAGAGVFGLIDDLAGSADRRGFKGHLTGLLRGEVTTGALKILGIGGTALATAVALDRDRLRPIGTPAAALLIASGANLMNLFDLRPGRALKVALLADLPLLVARPELGLVPVAVCLAAWPQDLAGRSMMGDTGANAIGAAIATGWAAHASTPARAGAAAAVAALMLSSEKVSFSAVIEANPVLRSIDHWGRRT